MKLECAAHCYTLLLRLFYFEFYARNASVSLKIRLCAHYSVFYEQVHEPVETFSFRALSRDFHAYYEWWIIHAAWKIARRLVYILSSTQSRCFHSAKLIDYLLCPLRNGSRNGSTRINIRPMRLNDKYRATLDLCRYYGVYYGDRQFVSERNSTQSRIMTRKKYSRFIIIAYFIKPIFFFYFYTYARTPKCGNYLCEIRAIWYCRSMQKKNIRFYKFDCFLILLAQCWRCFKCEIYIVYRSSFHYTYIFFFFFFEKDIGSTIEYSRYPVVPSESLHNTDGIYARLYSYFSRYFSQ